MKVLLFLVASIFIATISSAADPRNFDDNRLIPDQGYCDQPYIVIAKNGDWICTMTTGPGRESQPGQHVVATVSRNQGRTWSKLIDIEPSGDIESSWVVPFVVPSGRIYAFYNYNGDNVRKMGEKSIKPPTLLGWYVYKYSDDNGRTWSEQRHRLPMPLAAVDRGNDWQGRVQLFWGVDKPTVADGDAIFAFTRMGKFIHDLGEGWFYRSENLLTESDPQKIRWQLLPETDRGVRSDEMGSIQEEHNVVPLASGDLYCVYRTMQGYIGGSTSRDGGRTWTNPATVTYSPGGPKIKHPRGCAMIWRTTDGKYLLWIHNTSLQLHSQIWPMTGRDLAWLVGGIEREGAIHWSQPELVCYVPPRRGVSYPDLIEDDGRYFISATNKREARLIEVDRHLVDGLWNQEKASATAPSGLVLSHSHRPDGENRMPVPKMPMPRLPDLSKGGGFTLDMRLRIDDLSAGQVLLDTRTPSGRGFAVTTAGNGALRLEMSDGSTKAVWDSDPGLLKAGQQHQVAIIVDGGPKTIAFVIDGRLCDGGDDPSRPFGVGRFLPGLTQNSKPAGPELGDVSGDAELRIATNLKGRLESVRIYDRYLRTSEAIGNYRAGTTLSAPPIHH